MTKKRAAQAESPSARPSRGDEDSVSSSFLRQVFDINPHLIFAKDRQGRFTLVNRPIAELYGTSVSELIGKTDADFVPNEEQVAFFRKMDLEVMDTLKEAVIEEETITDCRGKLHWLRTVKRPIVGPDGRADQVLGVATDITSQKLAEEALRRSEERYRAIYDTSPIGIATADVKTLRMIHCNPAMTDLLGYSEIELQAKTITDITHPNDWPADRDLLKRRVTGYGAPESREKRYIRKDGTVMWAHMTTALLSDETGDRTVVLALVEDISRRKRDEMERQALEEQLRHSQKMDALGQLAGGVAHDFNNLLAVMLGNAERIMRHLDSKGLADDAVSGSLPLIISAGERAAGLVRQLLAFSRKEPVNPIVVDVNSLVSDLEEMLRRLIGEHLELETNLSTDLPCVRVDPSQFEQLVVNLVVNARDAMPDGGKLVIETTADAGKDALDRWIRVSVSDTGVGIPAENLPRVFDPFFTTKELGKGTGLGLSTVFGFVKQAGGKIECRSEVNRGTTFDVLLPATDLQPQPKPESVQPPPATSATVLVCEDEPEVLELIAMTLQEEGYQVLKAASGDAALRMAAQHIGPIDALVTDVVMPGIQGPKLASLLCADRPNVRVVYVTGYVPETLLAADTEGATRTARLVKPFRSRELLNALASVLQ